MVKESLGSGAGVMLWEEERHGGEGGDGFSEELVMGMNGDLLVEGKC